MADNTTSNMNMPLTATGRNVGYKLGSWLKDYKNKRHAVAFACLLAFLAFIIYSFVISYKNMDANKSLAENVGIYAKSISHSKCKSNGGCGVSCPFIDNDDPRMIIRNTSDLVTRGLEELEDEYKRRSEMIRNGLERIQDETARKIASGEIDIVDSSLRRCVDNVAVLSAIARNINFKYGDVKKPSVEVLNNRNNASTIRVAASVNINAFFASSANAIATMMYHRMKSIPPIDQSRITNYDDKIMICNTAQTRIKDDSNKIIQFVSPSGSENADSYIYANIIKSIQQEDKSDSQETNIRLAAMMNIGKEASDLLQKILSSFSSLNEEYNSVMMKVESFNNALPEGRIGSEDVSNLILDGDYNTALIRTALEPEIVKNHKKFANERATFDSGGGVPSVRDDDNDIVKWVGLFGRPTYRRSDGSSAERSTEPLRSIPSDNPTDLMRTATPRLTLS